MTEVRLKEMQKLRIDMIMSIVRPDPTETMNYQAEHVLEDGAIEVGKLPLAEPSRKT